MVVEQSEHRAPVQKQVTEKAQVSTRTLPQNSFFSPFNFSDLFSESISYDPAKAVIKTRPSVTEIPGLKRNI